jgi:hypothetical protein
MLWIVFNVFNMSKSIFIWTQTVKKIFHFGQRQECLCFFKFFFLCKTFFYICKIKKKEHGWSLFFYYKKHEFTLSSLWCVETRRVAFTHLKNIYVTRSCYACWLSQNWNRFHSEIFFLQLKKKIIISITEKKSRNSEA